MVLNRELPDVLCPKCTYPGGLAIFLEFVSKPIGSFSLAGAQMKLSVRQVPVLSCSLPGCKFMTTGYIQGGDAVFPDPHVQAQRG